MNLQKKNGEFVEHNKRQYLDWCSTKQPSATVVVLKNLMKNINPRLVKRCPIYGRYEVNKFSFGRQFFIGLIPNEYRFSFRLVDETTKTVMDAVFDFEIIEH